MPFFWVHSYPLLPRLVKQPLQLYMKIASHKSGFLYMERITVITLAWLWKKQFVYYNPWNIWIWNEERKSQTDSADLWHKCTYILDFLLQCSENFKMLEGMRQWLTLPPDCSLPGSFQMGVLSWILDLRVLTKHVQYLLFTHQSSLQALLASALLLSRQMWHCQCNGDIQWDKWDKSGRIPCY